MFQDQKKPKDFWLSFGALILVVVVVVVVAGGVWPGSNGILPGGFFSLKLILSNTNPMLFLKSWRPARSYISFCPAERPAIFYRYVGCFRNPSVEVIFCHLYQGEFHWDNQQTSRIKLFVSGRHDNSFRFKWVSSIGDAGFQHLFVFMRSQKLSIMRWANRTLWVVLFSVM